ncbi:hypothetical protein [Ralstonia phage RP31]|uniref:Uncharacterized protein n=2 Tax=Ripduovirus RP12 TaxID=2560700 RepID=A0A1L7N110_9CAUD|nr:hypothetical protein FDH28_gp232 [Ralstonia phage RP12]BAW19163.1 hypothetical protein [Ralstonia phage RP12]BAW19449.1 hypothetical protein [Ralstonia phage RP31]
MKPKNEKPAVQQEKPVAVAAPDQAPIIPFAPYSDTAPWDTEYSKTLTEKSNKLASDIWGDQKSYNKAREPLSFSPVLNLSEETQKNSQFFSKALVDNEIARIFTIPYTGNTDWWMQMQKVREAIKKLKNLERKYDLEDLLADGDREYIVNTALLPTGSFGVQEAWTSNHVGLRHPARPAVVNGILTDEEMQLLEMTINFIPRMREALTTWKQWDYRYTQESLLMPILDELQPKFRETQPRVLLHRIRDLASFFNRVIPTTVIQDHIPAMRYPNTTHQTIARLQAKSARLRDITSDFIQNRKPLSELLDQIVELSEALKEHFIAITYELDCYFGYLARIDMPFETLVRESSQRISDEGLPF